jgi:hypothetical protein
MRRASVVFIYFRFEKRTKRFEFEWPWLVLVSSKDAFVCEVFQKKGFGRVDREAAGLDIGNVTKQQKLDLFDIDSISLMSGRMKTMHKTKSSFDIVTAL